MNPPKELTGRQSAVLHTLHELQVQKLNLEGQISLFVKAAVVERCTWRAIGEALGVSGQAAWEKHRSEEAQKIAAGEK